LFFPCYNNVRPSAFHKNLCLAIIESRSDDIIVATTNNSKFKPRRGGIVLHAHTIDKPLMKQIRVAQLKRVCLAKVPTR